MKNHPAAFYLALAACAAALLSCAGGSPPSDGDTTETETLYTFETATEAGDLVLADMGAVSLRMVYANPFESITFPIGMSDAGACTLTTKFFLGECEVTFGLWKEIYIWATGDDDLNGSGFSGPYEMTRSGVKGSHNFPAMSDEHPVMRIRWWDAMAWCNALTEYYNAYNGAAADLDCVYYADADYAQPLRRLTSRTPVYTEAGSEDCPYIKAASPGNTSMEACAATGFRLPTSMEWEYAARWYGPAQEDIPCYLIGRNRNGGSSELTPDLYWTPGANAAGSIWHCTYTGEYADYGAFAWYMDNSLIDTWEFNGITSFECMSRKAGTKRANPLNTRDMSGNAWEWCFDHKIDDQYPNTEGRVFRGGACYLDSMMLAIGRECVQVPYWESYMGLRVARSVY